MTLPLRHSDESPAAPGTAPRVNPLIQAARLALDQYQHEEAIVHCEAALALPRLRVEQLATVRCLCAEAWENLALFTKATHALASYEQADARSALPPVLQAQVCLRLGAAYGGTREIPQALAYARQAVVVAQQHKVPSALVEGYLLLANLYRRLGETGLAREHFILARTEALHNHQPLLQAHAVHGLGLVSLTEGEWADARVAFELARTLLANAPALVLRGSIDINLAAVVALQGGWRESVPLLEKALPCVEQARVPRLIVNARSNLGYSLLRLGEMQRAQAVLEAALAEARACEATLVVASTLESLGELHCLQGKFTEAETFLQRSLEMLRTLGVCFNEEGYLTQGRCYLLAGQFPQAVQSFQASLENSERLGDPRGQAAAQLYLVEARLALGEQQEAQRLFAEVRTKIERMENTLLLGHLREVAGQLALVVGQEAEAIRHFTQAESIHELTGDRYRCALANYYLGTAFARHGNTNRARAALTAASVTFQELTAHPMLTRTGAALSVLPQKAETSSFSSAVDIVSSLMHLLEAASSRDLLLHEATRLLHEHFAASPVIVFQFSSEGE